jgi:hypothetical protein
MTQEDITKLQTIRSRLLIHAAAVEMVQEKQIFTLNLEILKSNLSRSYDELGEIISRNSPKE